MADYHAYDAGLPCKNPNCHSYGRPHPNCKCYSGGGPEALAKGGAVHFCASGLPHRPGCEYYAVGGGVGMPMPQQPAMDPVITMGHAVVNHGLLGLLKNAGHANLSDPEKHVRSVDKIKAHLAEGNADKAIDFLHESPLSAGVGKVNINHAMKHIGPQVLNNSAEPEALKGTLQYVNSAIKGHDELKEHSSKLFDPQKKSEALKHDEGSREGLKKYLSEVQENPGKMLDSGGKIGHYLPEHASEFGALTSRAVNYLTSIKPQQPQAGPLDDPMPVDQMAMDGWDRNLDIAQRPQLVLQHVKDGTLLPQDLITIQTLYPALFKSMTEKATESLIDAKTNSKEIPYKQKQALSLFLGKPLDISMTPQGMQAIIKSAGPQQMKNQEKKNPNHAKATDVELRQINKVDEMSETPLEARQINRNRH